MTCARREAGARRPAPSAAASSSPADAPRRPEPRRGRFGARLFFLPALALLLGALGLFTATPAQAQAPAAPTNLTITPSDTALNLSWTKSTGATGYDVHYTSAPASGNGAVINSASVQTGAMPSAAAGWVDNPLDDRSSTTTAIFDIIIGPASGLTNGTPYRVRVRAVNASGNSAWVFGSGTPAIVLEWPSTARSMTEDGVSEEFVFGSASISAAVSGTLTYAPGSSNPASLADDLQTGYPTTFSHTAGETVAFELDTSDDTLNEEHETFTITINAGTGYTVGTPSTVTVTIIDTDPPAAPALSLTTGNAQLTASWTIPAGPVEWYNLRYKEASAPDQAATGGDLSTGWVTNTVRNATSQIITGLTSDTAYHVQVRANDGQTETGNGDGAWSALQTGTPPSPPAAPASLNVAPGNALLSLTWVKPPGPVTGYDVHYTSATTSNVANDATAGSNAATAWVAVTRSGTTASQTISSLTNDTDYRVRVRAVNAGGDGAWAFGTGTPREAPTVSLEVWETASEGGYPVRIIAELSEAASSDVQVRFTLTLDTAELADFAAGSGVVFDSGAAPVTGARTVTVPAGKYLAEFEIATVHDDDGEDETFTVAIDTSSLPAGYIAGSPTSAQVTIDDDETRNADPDGLTGLTIHDGTRELYFDATTAGDQVGLGGPDAIYTVQVNPGIRSVTVTPTWTNPAINSIIGYVRYVTYGRDGGTVGWTGSESGTGKEVSLVDPGLGTPGTTRVEFTLVDSGSEQPYVFLFQHNFDWESANNRLGGLVMRASQSSQ